jgi:DNA-binding CsgD family transcriptional regulator
VESTGGARSRASAALERRARSLAQIAAAIGVSYKTVANTCTQIKAKLGVTRMADLVRLSIEMGVS